MAKNANTIWKISRSRKSGVAGPEDNLEDLLQRGFRYAFSLTHDRARAEDLLQDGWLSLLAAGGPRRRGYLFAAVRSRFIDGCRRERLLVFESLDDENGSGVYDLGEEPILADTAVLERALAELRPVEREVLLLADVEGYTAQEIADLTGHPRGTILSLIHRSHRKLRLLIEPHDEEIRRRE